MMNLINKMMAPLKRRVMGMISRAVIEAIKDSSGIQQLNIAAMAEEKYTNVPRVQEYGFTSHPLPGAEAVTVFLGGSRDAGVVIAVDDKRYRLTALAQGEVALYDDLGSKVHLKRGGNIDIQTSTKVKLIAPNTEVTGNLKVLGNLEVVGTSLLTGIVTTMNNILVGINAIVTGIVQAAGFTGPGGGAMSTTVDITTTGNVTGGGTNLASVKSTFNAHTHPETGTTTGATTSPL